MALKDSLFVLAILTIFQRLDTQELDQSTFQVGADVVPLRHELQTVIETDTIFGNYRVAQLLATTGVTATFPNTSPGLATEMKMRIVNVGHSRRLAILAALLIVSTFTSLRVVW
jgi:hypothetical protein